MHTYERRRQDEYEWHQVSEIACMQDLVESFDRVAPIIDDMLRGVEITTSRGIYRMRKNEFRSLMSMAG